MIRAPVLVVVTLTMPACTSKPQAGDACATPAAQRGSHHQTSVVRRARARPGSSPRRGAGGSGSSGGAGNA